MSDDHHEVSKPIRLAGDVFRHVEHGLYIVVGCLLCAGALVAAAGAAVVLWNSVSDWTGTDTIVHVIDRLLFVLLLTEVLHTVRASIRTGGLTGEPFLIVGLIASIRRVLVITLQTSEATKPGNLSPETQAVVHESMVELGVLGGLILVLAISLYLLGRTRQMGEDGAH